MSVFHDSISVTEMQPREYKEFPCVSHPVSIVTSIQCSYGTVLIANSSTLKKNINWIPYLTQIYSVFV